MGNDGGGLSWVVALRTLPVDLLGNYAGVAGVRFVGGVEEDVGDGDEADEPVDQHVHKHARGRADAQAEAEGFEDEVQADDRAEGVARDGEEAEDRVVAEAE